MHEKEIIFSYHFGPDKSQEPINKSLRLQKDGKFSTASFSTERLGDQIFVIIYRPEK